MRLSGARPDGLGAASGSRSSTRGRSPALFGPDCRPLQGPQRSCLLHPSASSWYQRHSQAPTMTQCTSINVYIRCKHPQGPSGVLGGLPGGPGGRRAGWITICVGFLSHAPFKKRHAYIYQQNQAVLRDLWRFCSVLEAVSKVFEVIRGERRLQSLFNGSAP